MGKIKNFTVSLDEEVVKEAREQLEIGQSLSPIINDLLKNWVNTQETKNAMLQLIEAEKREKELKSEGKNKKAS